MKTIKTTYFLAFLIVLAFLLLSCSGETGVDITTADPELTLGELPDYSDAHAEDAPYIVFSSELEPISAERIEEVRQAIYMMLYHSEYEAQTEVLKKTGLEGNALHFKAQELAIQFAKRHKNTILTADNLIYNDRLSYVGRYTARYYGTISGCEIISLHSLVEKESSLELGGVKIEDNNPFYIFVCKGEEVLSLSEAYGKGWLTPIDILLISKRNSDFNAYWKKNFAENKTEYSYVKFVDDLEDIPDELIAEIEARLYADAYEESYKDDLESYREEFGGIYSEAKIEGISAWFATIRGISAHEYFMERTNSDSSGWRYYGIIGGFAIFADVGFTDMVTEYHLGEYEIGFGNGTKMWVYSSEIGIIEIDDAYQRGLLTDADAAKIYERHTAYNEYIFK